ncbi:MAG: nuclear transport factor 2 family protein [Rubrivivax sp.]|nr:nuclear transport factor 2 family protein [Rubrivivax sp.]
MTASRGRLAATLAVAVTLLGALLLSSGGTPVRSDKPADVIHQGLIRATREGDVRGYLACFGEPLRGELKAAIDRQGRAAFAESLRASMQPVTGVTTSNVRLDGDRATLTLEWVYREDSDSQQVELRRLGGRWRITSMSGQTRLKLDVPYGTPVLQ